jgi:serine phosphatase RsbU (regulator of sigma subunit)
MEKIDLVSAIESEKSFIDVLYLTNQGRIPSEIQHLFKQKELSYYVMPLDKFSDVRGKLDSIGTIIIDAKNTDSSHQIVHIIEVCEIQHMAVIVLNDHTEYLEQNFFSASSKNSLSAGETSQVLSVDELWVKLSVNLSHRKKDPAAPVRSAIAPRQAQTIYKNRMSEQLLMAKALVDNLAEQLKLAGLVQQDFLPAKLPNSEQVQWATTFLPAEWVSGDIFDVVRIDEQHIGFYVADVVGHGMPAALLTIFLKQALVMRETVNNEYRIFSPSDVVKNLNIRMAAQKLSGYQFATCCYCLLNTKTLELSFARAGHPYPILIRPGRQPEQLEVRGSLLGVFEQAEYHQRTIQLQLGDKLLLYSDGAEPFIGGFNNPGGFGLTKEFINIKHLGISEMLDAFNSLIHNREIKQTEIDDITIVGLEIIHQ